jgi:hypothetical protein
MRMDVVVTPLNVVENQRFGTLVHLTPPWKSFPKMFFGLVGAALCGTAGLANLLGVHGGV